MRIPALRNPAVWIGLAFFSSPLSGFAEPARIKPLLAQAELFEQQQDWDKASEAYEGILKLERNLPEIRQRYLNSLRRGWQVRRHREPSFRKEVLSLDYGQAVKLYGVIFDTLLDQSVDRKSTVPAQLLQKGIEELNQALADASFCREYLPSFKLPEVQAFREYLQKKWGAMATLSRSQTLKQIREVALAAQSKLHLNATVAVMELACGACYALDDYTVYLTPSQLRELVDSLKGEFGGVGITLSGQDGKLVIAEVAPLSPAAEAMPPLIRGDQILAIDKKPLANLTPEAALELLDGPVGTTVDLEIDTPGIGMRTVSLRRRALFMPSVAYQMKSETVGYLHIASFQDTTLQEVDQALLELGKSDMKALVLDLRGNGGGLFEVAVEVAKRFLANGVIASTQNQDPRLNTIFYARNPAALGIPLVILVDGDTASSAEVVAGALKDNKRGRLVGQTTFGKSCTQSIFKLPPGPGGIPTGGLRITVARIFSPEGLPLTGRGVLPHLFIERLLMAEAMMDHQLEEAVLEAGRMVGQ